MIEVEIEKSRERERDLDKTIYYIIKRDPLCYVMLCSPHSHRPNGVLA